MEAGEPEERAAEENEVVEKDWERKAERMGSEAMESSADVAVAMLVVVVEKVGLVKVERRWRGEGLDLWSGDAGEAIFFSISGTGKEMRFLSFSLYLNTISVLNSLLEAISFWQFDLVFIFFHFSFFLNNNLDG